MTGIVILNYNNIDRTIECIERIDRYCKDIVKVVLVDNGSDEHVRTELLARLSNNYDLFRTNYNEINSIKSISLPHLSYIQIKENIGYARGNNAGGMLFEKDDTIETIMIQNNDIFLIQDIVTPMVKALYTLDRAMLVAPVKLKRDGKTVDEDSDRLAPYSYWHFLLGAIFLARDFFGILKRMDKKNHIDFKNAKNNYIEAGCPHGPCLMFKMSDWKKMEGFDPNTFLFNEEYITSRRIRNYGGKSYILTDCQCVHYHGMTTESQNLYRLAKLHQDSSLYYFDKIEKVGFVKINLLRFFDKLYLLKLKYLGSFSTKIAKYKSKNH
jgi:GT2 family glycosyltransferase